MIEKLPNDREGAVYLAYDLYYLGRYDEALALVKKYEPILHNDKDLPLIAGNVHAHKGELNDALKDFTLRSGTRSEDGHRICESRFRAE